MPEGGSEHILPTVNKLQLLKRCKAEKAKLLLVEFWEAYGWRRHGPLAQRLEENGDDCVLLDPAPLTSVEGYFDPVQHFRAWREVEGAHATGKNERKVALIRAIAEQEEDSLSLRDLATTLNADGLTTPTGKRWTAENLRKFLKAL